MIYDTYEQSLDLGGWEGTGISYYFTLVFDDTGQTYGEIRADLLPYFMSVHPKFTGKSTKHIRAMRKDLEDAIVPLAKDYEYDEVMVITNNHTLVRMLTDRKIEDKGYCDGLPEDYKVYRIEV